MAKLLLGKEVTSALNQKLLARSEALRAKGIAPKLAIVRCGEDPSQLSYERGAGKRAEATGVETEQVLLPENVTKEALAAKIRELNADVSVHGVLLLRPLPKHLKPFEHEICNTLAVEKDVDCMTDLGNAGVYIGSDTTFAPCTPQAVMELIEYYGISLTGKKAAVIGRSLVVGRPLAMMLIARHATVTVCHTRTKNLEEICRRADMIVACAGSARMIGPSHVRPETVLIDVGINADGDGICGDADYERISGIVSVITPVPGGVGSVTTSVLLKHVVESAERSAD